MLVTPAEFPCVNDDDDNEDDGTCRELLRLETQLLEVVITPIVNTIDLCNPRTLFRDENRDFSTLFAGD